MNNNAPPEIQQMVSNILKETLDKRTVKKLGTSIDQHMSRDYRKVIESKFMQLKNEFLSRDYNDDSYLSLEEFYRFFASKSPSIKKEEIQYLFESSEKGRNKRISLNEFIYIYLLLEEKLKMKKTSLAEVKSSLTSKLESYQKKLNDNSNEVLNQNGISNESEITVHIIELINLKGFLLAPKCKVILYLMNKSGNIIEEKETKMISGTSNPQFNERFSFSIQDYNFYIKCTLCNSENLIDQGLGSFIIDPTILYDQLPHDMWYDITEGAGNGSRAHVSLQFIYNNNKRYKDLISKTSQQIDNLTQNIFQIENVIEKINEPFGLIMYNKIKEVMDKKILNKSENVHEYLGSSRISVYAPDQRNSKFGYGDNSNSYIYGDKDETKIQQSELGAIPEEGDGNLINSNLLRNEINSEGFLPKNLNQYFPKNSSVLGKKSNQLIIFGIIASILNLIFGKIDLLNFLIYVFGFMMIYNMCSINGRINSKKYFFYILIGGIVLDILWVLFLNRDQNNQSSLFRAIVFGVTIFSMIIKIILCYLIKNRRR